MQNLPSSSMEKSLLELAVRLSAGVPGYAGGGERRCSFPPLGTFSKDRMSEKCCRSSNDVCRSSMNCRSSFASSMIDIKSIKLMRGSNWLSPVWTMLPKSWCCCCCCCCCWGTATMVSCGRNGKENCYSPNFEIKGTNKRENICVCVCVCVCVWVRKRERERACLKLLYEWQ